MLKRQFETQGIKIEIKLGRKQFLIYGNPTLMQQVVYNLAVNSRDALSGFSAKQIEFLLKRSSNKVMLDVKDNGSGIAPENLQNIFEPFFSTKTRGHGTGLGLSISNRIVKNHSGVLNCKNNESGKGALFRIILPLAK
ncbi:MAG: GHKL domain-containing protein [SAR324 cluster bacterium]|nr:GHKL domain-containing protein [SAR324 cluster bacterium]